MHTDTNVYVHKKGQASCCAFMSEADGIRVLGQGDDDRVVLDEPALWALAMRLVQWGKLTSEQRTFAGGLTAWIEHGMPLPSDIAREMDWIAQDSNAHEDAEDEKLSAQDVPIDSDAQPAFPFAAEGDAAQ